MKKIYFSIVLFLCSLISLNAQSFKMQIEQVDGTVISFPADLVKQISFQPIETYSISYNLSGVSSSNNVSTLADGMPFSTVLTPNDNCYISFVSITMGGNDITSTSFHDGMVNIEKVSGNIQISATSTPYKEGVDLSALGNANCYIVSESGYYKFNISGYNGTKAFLLWNENGASDITDVELSGSYIFFKKDNFKAGNAVISLADEVGEIVWSWHIWSTDKPKAIEINGQKWLDRNLGATSSEPNNIDTYGLWYNPGNPFPFPGPKYSNFIISETPSVPDGWYVADGYGYYASSEMPSPKTPMQLCNRTDVFGNSVYFRIGYNQCPYGLYLPSASAFQALLGYEPTIKDNGVYVSEDLFVPCLMPFAAEDSYKYGRYLCSGKYNSTAVDTWIIYFYEGVSKKTYCQGAALLPIRCMCTTY